MATLYIDTSYYLSVALFSKEFTLTKMKTFKESKSSKILHFEIQKLLDSMDLTLQSDIQNVVISSGPGSYTGIRLAEGIAQLFEMVGLKVYSFYHFDLLSNQVNSAWISKAYKGEYFVFASKESKMSLVKKEDLIDDTKSYDQIYTHFLDSLDMELGRDIESTFELLIKDSRNILPSIINEERRETPFYYRKLEDEFKVSIGG